MSKERTTYPKKRFTLDDYSSYLSKRKNYYTLVYNKDAYDQDAYDKYLIRDRKLLSDRVWKYVEYNADMSRDLIDNKSLFCDRQSSDYISNQSIDPRAIVREYKKDPLDLKNIRLLGCVFKDISNSEELSKEVISYTMKITDNVHMAVHQTDDLNIPVYIIKTTDGTMKSFYNTRFEGLIGSIVGHNLRSLIPNFSCVYGGGDCFKIGGKDLCKSKDGKNTYAVLQEYIDGITMSEWIESEDYNFDDYVSLVLQVIMSLCMAQDIIGFTHNDLHLGNIMVRRGVKGSKINYIIKDRDTFVDYQVRSNYIATIIDYGRSSCENIYKDRYDGQYERLFAPFGMMFYIYPESNYSYDCVRFCCSVYQFLEDREEDDEVINYTLNILTYFFDRKNRKPLSLMKKLDSLEKVIMTDSSIEDRYERINFIKYMVSNSLKVVKDRDIVSY